MKNAETEKKAEGVILAAGYSSRAGAFKPALDLGGQSVLEHCVLSMLDFCTKIYVVGGYKIDRIRQLLGHVDRTEVVDNPAYDQGMFTSVKEGLRHVTAQRAFLIPADYPLVKKETYRKMLATAGRVVVPTYHGRRGHPVLLDHSIISRILSDPDDSNLRTIIDLIGFETVEVDDEGILIDLDTPGDYRYILEKIKEGDQ